MPHVNVVLQTCSQLATLEAVARPNVQMFGGDSAACAIFILDMADLFRDVSVFTLVVAS